MLPQATDVLQSDTDQFWYVTRVEDGKVYGHIIKPNSSPDEVQLKGDFKKVPNVNGCGEYDRLEQTIPEEPILYALY